MMNKELRIIKIKFVSSVSGKSVQWHLFLIEGTCYIGTDVAIAICTTCANLIFGKYWQSSSAGITAADFLPD